ncbi:MAG: oligopeptide/dipeptide transporter, permease protein, partial [Clostridiales bacterium]|nr:oligopeptide/dipeptide transporter, permease protein [Clostridiales bacterium]
MKTKYEQDLFQIVGYNDDASDTIVRPNITYWQDAWRRLKKNKIAMFSMCILAVIILSCIFIPIFSQVDYTNQSIENANQLPSSSHWFGLDELGRDIFVRIWIGGRVSILIGFIGTAISFVIGMLYGGISGYLGGVVDDVMMRIVEVLVG